MYSRLGLVQFLSIGFVLTTHLNSLCCSCDLLAHVNSEKQLLKCREQGRKFSKRKSQAKTSLPGTPRAEELAKRLETLLFHKSNSLEEYANEQTLEDWFKSLLSRMLGRCILRAASQEHSSRERTLCLVLGKDRLRQVIQLVKTIKRMQLAAPSLSSSSTGKDRNALDPLESKSTSSCIVLKPLLDKPLRDLFLKTSLVQALEFTPTENLHKLPWDDLIFQAEQVVTAYQHWKTQKLEESKLLTNSNIRALEHELNATAADIIQTFA